jgi:hypothetical protein
LLVIEIMTLVLEKMTAFELYSCRLVLKLVRSYRWRDFTNKELILSYRASETIQNSILVYVLVLKLISEFVGFGNERVSSKTSIGDRELLWFMGIGLHVRDNSKTNN